MGYHIVFAVNPQNLQHPFFDTDKATQGFGIWPHLKRRGSNTPSNINNPAPRTRPI
jgi:hypothetical protein